MEGLIFGILRYFELSPDICITEVVLLFIRFTCVKNLNLVLFSKYLVDSNSGVLNKWYNLENKNNANNAIKYFRKSSLSFIAGDKRSPQPNNDKFGQRHFINCVARFFSICCHS